MVRRVISLAACAAVSSIYCASVLATPYASGVSESAGVVSFRLNEAADSVTIIRDGVPEVIGVLPAGVSTFNRNGAANYKIVVNKNSGPGYKNLAPSSTGTFTQGAVLQTSSDANKQTWFNSPRGIALDNSVTSPNFGRIYVSNSAAATVGTAPNTRSVGDGMYAMNSDFTDAVGQGDTARTGGINWGLSTNSPWHLGVGPDQKLYITDWSDGHGGIFRVDSDLNNGVEVLLGAGDTSNPDVHGSIASKPVFEGSGADFKIYALDEDMTGDPLLSKNPNATTFQNLLRWDVGTATAYDTPPTKISDFPSAVNNVAGVLSDLARAPDGKFYFSENRSGGLEPGLIVKSSDGATVLWDSLTETRALVGNPNAADFFKDVQTMQVAPDGSGVAMVTLNSDFYYIPIDSGTGLPDMSKAKLIESGSVNNGRDIGFDAAGNIYMVTSGHARLRVFGQGGITETTYDSSGTLTVSNTTFDASWIGNGGGVLGDTTKWQNGVVPGSGQSGTFGSSIGGPSNISTDAGGNTIGSIWIDTANTLTFDGAGTLTFASPVQQNSGVVVVQGGGHSITAPVQINSNFVATIPANSNFTINNATQSFAGGVFYANAGTNSVINVNNLTVTANNTINVTGAAGASLNFANVTPVGAATLTTAVVATLQDGATLTIGGSPRLSNITANTIGNSTVNIPVASYTATPFSVSKSGTGTLSVSTLNASTLTITKGTVKTGLNAGTSFVRTLSIGTINNSIDWQGALDLNQKLAYDYVIGGTGNPTVSPLPFVQAMLQSGYNNGAWTGLGINSSAAAAAAATTMKGAIAYFEASATTPPTTSFGTRTLDATSIGLMYTAQGDATLDGKVNTLDFNILAGQFGNTTPTYVTGDFNYDLVVDSVDFGLLVENFGAVIPLSAPSLGAVVPEPATLAVLGLAPIAMLRRRR